MIVTVTLNPAIDRLYIVDKFIPGDVQRVSECHVSAGGKGINVAFAASILGERVTACGLAGGTNGDFIRSELYKSGIVPSFVSVEGQCRTCVSLHETDTGRFSSLLEPGIEISPADCDRFFRHFESMLTKADTLVLSGSLPPGMPKDTYNRLTGQARAEGKSLILDASGDALALALKAEPTLVKPNLLELSELVGESLSSVGEIVAAAKRAREMGALNVLASLGERGAVLVCDEGVFWGDVPKTEPVSTVGCGDSMLAAFAAGIAGGEQLPDIFKKSLAVAAANALTSEAGRFNLEDVKRLLKEATVKKL